MGTLKTFKQFCEAADSEKGLVFTFGRFNPPSSGHAKLLNAVKEKADALGLPYKIFVSHTEDSKKNPLPYKDKIKFMRKMFSSHARQIIEDVGITKVMDVLVKAHGEGISNIIMVVGSDRVEEFKKLLAKYNGVSSAHGLYNFASIEIVSAGERDPDSDDVSGMSASKLRAAATDKDIQAFSKGVPTGFGQTAELFNAVRKGLGLKESHTFRGHIELPRVSRIRESFAKGEVFLPGTKVTDGNEVFVIKEACANYLKVISSHGEKRLWLHQVTSL